MHSAILLMKREFINKWKIALNVTCCKVPIQENKKIIKQTAAVALAATKGGSTAWSRAIIKDAYDQMNNKALVKAVMGSDEDPTMLFKKRCICFKSSSNYMTKHKLTRRKMIRRIRSRSNKELKARSLAKYIVKKQTQVLRKLLPGGVAIDESCLIEEALDYIVSLKTQVDVMKELVNVMQLSS